MVRSTDRGCSSQFLPVSGGDFPAFFPVKMITVRAVSWLALAAVAHALQPLARSPAPRATTCKCYPGDSCWPTDAQWSALNQTVGGRLVKAIPPGAVCYESFQGTPTEDAAKCAAVAAQWTNSSWT
jgi:hypothetical protein